ncbi:MAG TPA: S41 family peptidase [Verrucomicrobiae bacterium]|nr:S41 family peptidase [Verrucomicrobiae bacterium]
MTRRLLNGILLSAIFTAAGFSVRADSSLAKSEVLEKDVAYLRVATIKKNLAPEIQSAQSALAVSNKIDGTVLDLRFAGGNDAEAAKAIADLFASKKAPLAILVNVETTGAAVKLAEELRSAHDGLVFGNSTEIEPDVAINIKPSEEKEFLQNPYIAFAQSDTNSAGTNSFLSFVEHISEADLVRAKIKDGAEAENFMPAPKAEAPKKVLRDPVLARALDLVRGMAIFNESHS